LELVDCYTHPATDGKMNAVRALERQVDDIDSHNIVAIAKVTSMPKVVNNSNN